VSFWVAIVVAVERNDAGLNAVANEAEVCD